MRTVIAIITLAAAFIALWPVLTRMGRKAAEYFGKLNGDEEPVSPPQEEDDDMGKH